MKAGRPRQCRMDAAGRVRADSGPETKSVGGAGAYVPPRNFAMILATDDLLLVEVPTLESDSRAAHVTLSEGVREQILRVLQDTGWRIREPGGAAEIPGVKPTTLEARMAKLGITRPRRGSSSEIPGTRRRPTALRFYPHLGRGAANFRMQPSSSARSVRGCETACLLLRRSRVSCIAAISRARWSVPGACCREPRGWLSPCRHYVDTKLALCWHHARLVSDQAVRWPARLVSDQVRSMLLLIERIALTSRRSCARS
jgi:hypothetical protein